MKKFLIILLVLIVIFVIYMVATPVKEDALKNGERVIHTYTVSEGKTLLVDNWDCGATCASHTYVYLQSLEEKKLLFSCEHVSNIEFIDVTETSAKISTLDGDGSCKYKVGDIISY